MLRSIIAAKHETDPQGEAYVSTDRVTARRRLAIHLNAGRDRVSMAGALAGTPFTHESELDRSPLTSPPGPLLRYGPVSLCHLLPSVNSTEVTAASIREVS